jgi:hypothetical protein
MKDKFLQMAGVNSEEEFYSMFPTEEAFFQAYPEARQMKKGGNVPTNPELYSRVKSEAKSKFDRWPSAYGSAWLVKTYKSRGGGYKKAQTGGGMEQQQIFQYPNYDGNMASYYNKMNEDRANNPMSAIGDFMVNGAMAAGTAMDNAEGNGEDKMQMAKLAMNVMGMPAMGMGGVGMMMRDNYYDEGGEMAMGQIMAMNDKIARLQNFINGESEVEPWVASKLTLADDYISSVADYLQFNEGSEEGEEEEEDIDMNMGEMEEMKMGGIPQRYKNRGFTKVGAKRKSDRAGKKWMVLAKKGDKYKIVHGGYVGMKDFSQHGSQKRKDNFWNRMGGKNSSKATDPFSPLYWHKRFGTWANGGEPSNAGFQALPPYVQAKILSNMAEGGTYGSAPINTFMSPGIDNDPKFEQYYNQQLQQFNKAGVKQVPSRNDIYSYYQSSNPQSAVDQTGRMIFNSAPGTISSSTTFSQAVDPNTGKVLNQGTNLEKSAFDQQARRFQEGGPSKIDTYRDPRFEQYYNQQIQQLNQSGVKKRDLPSRNQLYQYFVNTNPPTFMDQSGRMIFNTSNPKMPSGKTFTESVDPRTGKPSGNPIFKEPYKKSFQEGGTPLTEEQKAAAAEAAAKKKKRNETIAGIGLGIGTAAGVIASEIRAARKQRGYDEFMNSNDPRLGTGQYPSNKELRKMGRRMYGGDTDMYGGEMDMDAMYQMMKGGQPCYECGGKVYQQGGQQDEVMQAIQMYAQMTQTDPQQLMAQLQALPPLEQQEAIQKIMQAIQEAQAGQMKNGGIYINPANKGKFTESANRAGMGVQEFARKVLANKEDYSATQVKRANFARNAASWKKQFGGMTEGAELELHPDEIQALIDQGYGIEYLD